MIYSCLKMIKRSDKDRSIHLAPNELLPVVTSSRPALLELLGKTCFPVYLNLNLNSLLVKRQIDNPSPGAVTGGS